MKLPNPGVDGLIPEITQPAQQAQDVVSSAAQGAVNGYISSLLAPVQAGAGKIGLFALGVLLTIIGLWAVAS